MKEMTPLILSLYLASGVGWFVGLGILACVAAVDFAPRRRWWAPFRSLLVIAAMLLIVISGTPAPIWFYAALILAFAAWALLANDKLTARMPARIALRARYGSRFAVIIIAFAAMLLEWPHYRLPVIDARGMHRIYVVGDSISSGIESERTWVDMLADHRPVRATNLARAGTTLADAPVQLARIEPGPALVFIEMGGNDLLGNTTAADFEARLRELLTSVCTPDRRIVMFELPLPPLKHAFGAIQRRLAAEYGVTLVPKRVLASVIRASGATLDGLHLSPAGHALLAAQVARMLDSSTAP